MKTKLFSFFLALIASAGTILAQSGTCGVNLTWDLTNGVLTISGTGPMTDYRSESKVPWYSYRTSIIEVSIGNSVTSIGDYAFYDCTGLTSITIPNSVISIGNGAFAYCSGLTSITIPNSVISIGNWAFAYCSGLTSLTILNGVTSIGDGAFSDCTGLTSVTIPNSVISIGNWAFAYCSGLTSITIPNSVISIGNWAFSDCTGLTSVTIPNSVTSIGDGAFSDCTGLTSLTILNGVTSIGDEAFSDCTGLTSVTIPNSVTSIGSSAFSGCSGLTAVTIPNSVTSIGGSAFSGCTGLTSITIPNSVTSIEGYTFSGCTGLTSVTIPSSVTSIGYYAFYGCTGLTSITIPNSVTSIGYYAFNGCTGLTSVTIPNSVTSIENEAFQNCSSLTSVVWNAKNCNAYKFGSQVTSFILGDSVEVIPSSLCFGMNKLTSIEIPSSVTSIGTNAFNGCTGLAEVHIIDIVAWCKIAFSNNTANPLYHAKHLYLNDSEITELVIPQGFTSIGSFAFYNCIGLTSVTIPNSITNIGTTAFSGCSGLTSVTIPNSVTSIRTNAFYGCSGLTSVTIPNSVTSIGKDAFENCSSLTSVVWNAKNCNAYNFGSQVESFVFGDSVEVIPAELCKGMNNLSTITIPQNVTNIGNNAFQNCSSLTSVVWNAKNCNAYNFGSQVESFVFDDSVEVIPANLCSGMDKPTKLAFPASLKTIGNNAFEGWKGIKQLHIPNQVEQIGANAFKDCIYLTSIYLGNKVDEIGDYAFKGCIRVNDITCMNTITPVVYDNTLSSISPYAYLYIQAGSKRTYQLDPYWSRFDIREIASSDTTLTQDKVIVVANDDNAVFTWPTDTSAATYSLQITKDGVVFCTLVFNSNGQLIGIAFAPSHNGSAHTSAATTSIAGMSFTVTGLNTANKYAYSLTVADNNQQELVTYRGEFATTGYSGEVTPGGEPERPEALDNPSANIGGSRKFLHNGQIFILRGDKTYTIDGRLVK